MKNENSTYSPNEPFFELSLSDATPCRNEIGRQGRREAAHLLRMYTVSYKHNYITVFRQI